jgi:hypothetical protein
MSCNTVIFVLSLLKKILSAKDVNFDVYCTKDFRWQALKFWYGEFPFRCVLKLIKIYKYPSNTSKSFVQQMVLLVLIYFKGYMFRHTAIFRPRSNFFTSCKPTDPDAKKKTNKNKPYTT